MVMGLGQYPNLGVQDAFACVRRGDAHHVVRASRELGDRMDTTRRAVPRRGASKALAARALRPRADRARASPSTSRGRARSRRSRSRASTSASTAACSSTRMRFAQTGCWTRHARRSAARRSPSRPTAGGARATARGACVRSARRSTPGIRQGEGQMTGHVELLADAVRRLLDPLHPERDRRRRARRSRRRCASGTTRRASPSGSGGPSTSTRSTPGTRMIESSVLALPATRPAAASTVDGDAARALLHRRRHRLRHGARLAPRHVPGPARRAGPREVGRRDREPRASTASSTTSRASRSSDGAVGYGLHEHGFFGPFPKYGMHDGASGAE